ncbi:unnamed protein product [Ceratitis capitata]|uniref:(Mediterranean fruit fly) hypothetical protein n=2 Tax=Ceratitis capitata TaxID=7213 RepID=A0A811UP78_CERCA|nr:unnamed protein product [Ceratitis capitata]
MSLLEAEIEQRKCIINSSSDEDKSELSESEEFTIEILPGFRLCFMSLLEAEIEQRKCIINSSSDEDKSELSESEEFTIEILPGFRKPLYLSFSYFLRQMPQGCNFTDILEIFLKLRYLLSFAKSYEVKFSNMDSISANNHKTNEEKMSTSNISYFLVAAIHAAL